MKRFAALLMMMSCGLLTASAQCAMCKTTLENNISNGNIGIAAGINFGIMYLFFTPYIAVAVIGYLWYRTSKSNEQKQFRQRTAFR
jgi:hypothetical protein